MKYSDTYTLTLKKIAWRAQSIQAKIKTFQPDLIIVLARGGFAPLWASSTYMVFGPFARFPYDYGSSQ
jgi:hypoxanthine phosphoribosyltransferase